MDTPDLAVNFATTMHDILESKNSSFEIPKSRGDLLGSISGMSLDTLFCLC